MSIVPSKWVGGSSDDQATQHVTQEMYKHNLELAERNKTLMLLQHIDEVVLSSTNLVSKVTQLITDSLIGESEFSLAIIYVSDKDGSLATASGFSFQQQVNPEIADLARSQLGSVSLVSVGGNSLSRAIALGEPQLATNFSEYKTGFGENDSTSLQNTLGVNALFVCPLKSNGRLLGILILGVPTKKEEISAYITGLAKRLTSAVSIAIENHVLYEELQEATVQLKAQNTNLQQLDKVKDDFLGMATHQLGTPLIAVDGYLSMINTGISGPINDKQRKFLEQARYRLRLMQRMVADFLDVSRMEVGRFVIEPTPTDLNKVVVEEVDQLQHRAQETGVSLTLTMPKEPIPTTMLDEQKTRQAVMNLIDNAIHYTPKGKVHVYLQSTPTEVVLQVIDNGIGVPLAQQSKLFSKYYRADNAKVERPNGNGIGLYLVKRVVEDQGGRVIFKSEEGKGSTFGFRLPLNVSLPKPAPLSAQPTAAVRP